MRPVRACRAPGFTLIEAAVVVAVLAILVGVGVPNMSNWILGRKVAAAAAFYKEGLMLARSQAVARNSASRLVLVDNDGNGQMDWRVDVCFPTESVPCDDRSGAWSTTDAPAGDDPDPANGFRSVRRSAAALPNSDILAATALPLGATEVYFTPLGWVDSRSGARLARIRLEPAPARAGAFAALALALPLSGIAMVCNPNASGADPKRCPP